MSVTLISDDLVSRHAAAPSTAKQAMSLREDVDEALGSGYEVFLQGSYRNRTGVADLNDVDIVALSTTVHSTVGQGPPAYPVSWDEIFGRVERALNSHWRFTGRGSRGDKCVRVATELALDIVPAIYRHDPDTDPIEVYSFRESSRRDNFPRDHWQNGVTKNNALHTDGAFKPTVRLFKRGLCRPVRNRLLMSGFAACRRDARYRQIRPVRRRSFAIRLHRGDDYAAAGRVAPRSRKWRRRATSSTA